MKITNQTTVGSQMKMDETPFEVKTSDDSTSPVNRGEVKGQGTSQEGIPQGQQGQRVGQEVDPSKVLRSYGITPTPELQEAVRAMARSGMPVNKETVRTLQQFLHSASGSVEEKLASLRALINKGLPVTMEKLLATHEALQGRGIAQLISKQKLDQVFDNFLKELSKDSFSRTSQSTGSNLSTFVAGELDGAEQFQGLVNRNMEEIWNSLQNSERYGANEALQAQVQLTTKDLVVTQITKRLGEVNLSFTNLKKEVTRNLENIILTIRQAPGNSSAQVKHLLENAIDRLDKAILKSDLTLFTDMKTEKDLMNLSSQLADAKRWLAKGETAKALDLVQDVKTRLENIRWQAADVKVKHFILNETGLLKNLESTADSRVPMQELTSAMKVMDASPRGIFNLVRALGLNYEGEVAQHLSLQGDDFTRGDLQKNLKAMLLNMGGERSAQVEQALLQLTGQQLLSKPDAGSNLQTMFFNLPFFMGNKQEQVKIFINSKKEGQKIDWENCSLYFLIDTKKLGETGILIQSVDRNLSITLKNDTDQFKERMEPIVGKYKENLKEIGYSITGINFTKLTIEEEKPVKQVKAAPSLDNGHQVSPSGTPGMRKGFDLKI